MVLFHFFQLPWELQGHLQELLEHQNHLQKHLEELLARGHTNGVKNLKIVKGDELREMEPHLDPEATAALYSPDAGTLIPYEYTIALAENAADKLGPLSPGAGHLVHMPSHIYLRIGRYHDASIGMRMMRDPAHNRAAAARRVIDNAQELRAFGELLIDLRDRKRLVFTDAEVDRDLSFAVEWLERVPEITESSLETVDTYFGPALSRPRLAHVREHIGLTLTRDPQRELLELKELNTRRPEVFPKLFFVLTDIRDLESELSAMQPRFTPIQTECGPSWVARLAAGFVFVLVFIGSRWMWDLARVRTSKAATRD